MPLTVTERLRVIRLRLRERLWVRPLVVALLSVAAAFVSTLADGTGLREWVPETSAESVEQLLAIMAASMLVIATFAVASMVSAYASAGSVATARAFPLIVRDDSSQNALSTFVGAFIFSIVSLTAVLNDYFGPAGLFCLFGLTLMIFASVIVTFVRWVDRIARLGRLGTIIDRVEQATADALDARKRAPHLGGVAPQTPAGHRTAVYSASVGYVQHVDVPALQEWATRTDAMVEVAALPGMFVAPGRPLAWVTGAVDDSVQGAFGIGDDRTFEDDPRFGVVVLSEIAGRALSPAVNDPGTAIDIIGTYVRLFVAWHTPADRGGDRAGAGSCDRVMVPLLAPGDLCDDAFTAIARDGAGTIEVAVRLQKALQALSLIDGPEWRRAVTRHSRSALARAEQAMTAPDDLAAVRTAAEWSTS
jgi:uncharacterized membrane protein